MYHMVTTHDDDYTGGTALDLAAADFIDGESEVRLHPKTDVGAGFMALVGIAGVEHALSAASSQDEDDGSVKQFIKLQPTNWADSEAMVSTRILNAVPTQDVTTTDFGTLGWAQAPLYIEPMDPLMGVRHLATGTDLINPGDSVISAGANAVASLNVSAQLYFQSLTAPRNPTRGGPTVRIRKAASADVTADVWSAVVTEELDDDGLDTDATYRLLAGSVSPEAAQDSSVGGWRMSVGGADWLGGIGPGPVFTENVFTVFREDSLPTFRGDDEVKIQALADAACKPNVTLILEQVTAGRNDGGSPILKGGAKGTAVVKQTTAQAAQSLRTRLQMKAKPSARF